MAPKGTTQRVSDGGAVDLDDAKQAWAEAARPVLERVAGSYNLYIEHKDLAESVQQDTGITTGVLVHHWIGSVLGAVARDRRAPDEPMLSSLCVRTDGTVGSDYGESVLEREGAVPADLDLHAAEERLACYRYFGADLPPDGGKPMLTRQLRAKRSRVVRQPERAPRRQCQTCFIEVAASGVCGICGE
jgi:hypothetical protein